MPAMRGASGTHCSTPDVLATPKGALGAEFSTPTYSGPQAFWRVPLLRKTDRAGTRSAVVSPSAAFTGALLPLSVTVEFWVPRHWPALNTAWVQVPTPPGPVARTTFGIVTAI